MALQAQQRISDLLPFYHAALNREFLCSTALGDGFAYPHARLSGVPALSFAFGMLEEPICWNKSNSSTVQMVFLSAVPASDAAAYLALVSGFAALARQGELRRQMHDARTGVAILDVFQQVKLRGAFRSAESVFRTSP